MSKKIADGCGVIDAACRFDKQMVAAIYDRPGMEGHDAHHGSDAERLACERRLL